MNIVYTMSMIFLSSAEVLQCQPAYQPPQLRSPLCCGTLDGFVRESGSLGVRACKYFSKLPYVPIQTVMTQPVLTSFQICYCSQGQEGVTEMHRSVITSFAWISCYLCLNLLESQCLFMIVGNSSRWSFQHFTP